MLNHHRFVSSVAEKCQGGWLDAGVPVGMKSLLEESCCDGCGSTLIAPHPVSLRASMRVESDPEQFDCLCLACSYSGPVAERMLEALAEAHEYDPGNGGDDTLQPCDACGVEAFLTYKQSCQ